MISSKLTCFLFQICSIENIHFHNFSTMLCFAFSSCSWGSHGKNTGVVCHCLLQWTTFCQNSPLWPSVLGGLHGMTHSFIELFKPLHHDKAVIHGLEAGERFIPQTWRFLKFDLFLCMTNLSVYLTLWKCWVILLSCSHQ